MHQVFQNHIRKGNLKEALEQLALYGPEFSNEIILTEARLSGLEDNVRLGIISHSDAQINRNQITQAVMSLAKGIYGVDLSQALPISTTPNMKPLQSLRTRLDSIIKKIKFDKEFREAKKEAIELRDTIIDYQAKKDRDPFVDADESIKERIEKLFDKFDSEWGRKLRTRQKVKIDSIKKLMIDCENDLSKNTLGAVIRALVAHNTKYSELKDSFDTISEDEIEGLAYQVSEIVERL